MLGSVTLMHIFKFMASSVAQVNSGTSHRFWLTCGIAAHQRDEFVTKTPAQFQTRIRDILHKMNELLDRIATMQREKQKVLVGIYGVPGAGKSTIAAQIGSLVNDSLVLPMDGFHYYKSELDQMDDPELSHQRRGAPFTFDSFKFIGALKGLIDGNTTRWPDFDHKTGDPLQDKIAIVPTVRVFIVEGLYLNLNTEPWRFGSDYFDILVKIEVPQELGIERLVKRHLQSGICGTITAARMRVHSNDVPNGILILENEFKMPDIVIKNV